MRFSKVEFTEVFLFGVLPFHVSVSTMMYRAAKAKITQKEKNALATFNKSKGTKYYIHNYHCSNIRGVFNKNKSSLFRECPNNIAFVQTLLGK